MRIGSHSRMCRSPEGGEEYGGVSQVHRLSVNQLCIIVGRRRQLSVESCRLVDSIMYNTHLDPSRPRIVQMEECKHALNSKSGCRLRRRRICEL